MRKDDPDSDDEARKVVAFVVDTFFLAVRSFTYQNPPQVDVHFYSMISYGADALSSEEGMSVAMTETRMNEPIPGLGRFSVDFR